jgi:hypothetical protein
MPIDWDDSSDQDAVLVARVPPAPPGSGEPPPCDLAQDDLALLLSDGAMTLPEVPGASAWDLRFSARFGTLRADWTTRALPDTSWMLQVHETARLHPLQAQWLSELLLEAQALDDRGRVLATATAPALWFVLPDGQPPRWFDDLQRAEQAPVGAWAPNARASVASLEGRGQHLLTVQPPLEVAP